MKNLGLRIRLAINMFLGLLVVFGILGLMHVAQGGEYRAPISIIFAFGVLFWSGLINGSPLIWGVTITLCALVGTFGELPQKNDVEPS